MSSFETYIPATRLKRLGAGITNFMCLVLFFTIINYMCLGLFLLVFEEGLQKWLYIETERNGLIFAVACILSVLFPESPGKRVFNIVVTGKNKEEIGKRIRLIRVLPYLLLAISLFLVNVFEGRIMTYSLSLIYLLSLPFIILNWLSIFLPERLSIMDMLLKTRVLTPEPLKEKNQTYLLGDRIM